MVVSVFPFLVQDNAITTKEIFHGCYHPVVHHFAMFLASVPCAFIFALVVSVIIVPMLKVRAPVYLFVKYVSCTSLLRVNITDGVTLSRSGRP